MVPPTIKNSVLFRHGRIVVWAALWRRYGGRVDSLVGRGGGTGEAWSDIHFGAVKPLIFGRLYTPQTAIQALQIEKCRKYS
jgi:hypothetical protein